MANSVIGALRVNLGLNSAEFSNGLKSAGGKASGFGKKVGGIFKGVGLAAAGVGAALAVAVKGSLDTADELMKTSQQVGTTVEELSRLKHAADLAGVTFTQLTTGMRRLSQSMKDGSEGVPAAAEAFEALGIEVTNADGTLKDTVAVMLEMGEAFSRMPDGAMKTALAMDLMGRSGASLIPLMNGGAEAMRSAMTEADALGIVIDEKTGKAAERFNDNLNRLKKTFGGLVVQISADLAPHLADFSDWLVANAPAIRQFATDAIEALRGLIDITRAVVEMSGQALQAASGMAEGIAEAFGQLSAVWDDVAGKIDWVTGKFAWMYDAVVGNSFVPDMVTGIADSLAGLDAAMVRPIESALDRAVDAVAAGTFSVRDMLAGLAADVAKMFLRTGLQSLLGGILGGGGVGAPLNLLAGARAMGGPVAAGAAYLVGEHGPEIFAPTRSGSIVPNHAFGGGGEVTVRINASPEFEAKVEAVAGRVAVETTRAGIATTERRRPREQLKRG